MKNLSNLSNIGFIGMSIFSNVPRVFFSTVYLFCQHYIKLLDFGLYIPAAATLSLLGFRMDLYRRLPPTFTTLSNLISDLPFVEVMLFLSPVNVHQSYNRLHSNTDPAHTFCLCLDSRLCHLDLFVQINKSQSQLATVSCHCCQQFFPSTFRSLNLSLTESVCCCCSVARQ